MKELYSFKDNKIIKVITGMRRSGKSTLMEMYKDELLQAGVNGENIQYFNLELMKYEDITDYKALYDLVDSQMKPGKTYLFFDEIERISDWERAINSLSIEYDVDIYITGSNAYLLAGNFATLLSGRFVEIKILPLSFKEYYGYYEGQQSKEELFQSYLKYGSLPQILTLPQDDKTINTFLTGIYNTIIIEDIMENNDVKDVDLLKRVFLYLCSNTGSITSASKISVSLAEQLSLDKSIRNQSISKILTMLEKAFIIYTVPRYDIKGKEVLKSLEKYYITDTGIRNSQVGYSISHYAYTIENVVYLELIRRGYKVYAGKCDSNDVDFVAVDSYGKTYFQVANSILDEDARKRETKPLYMINDLYQRVLITTDSIYAKDLDGIKVYNIIEFLLEDY